jgi:hypothetical protein
MVSLRQACSFGVRYRKLDGPLQYVDAWALTDARRIGEKDQ